MELKVGDYVTLIDPEDFEKVKHFSFGFVQNYVVCYGVGLSEKGEYLHRLIMKITDSKVFVDHINRNRSDNRKENLRLCAQDVSAFNKGCNIWQSNPTSKYRGVHKHQNKFRSELWCKGKRYGRKCFKYEIEAAIAYDALVKEHHGEFGILNFPTPEALFNACNELARLKVKTSKDVHAPESIFAQDPPRNGGSYGTQKPEKTGQVLQSYAQYLPSVLQATNSQAVPTAQANLAADQATAGGEAALNTQLTGQYAPQLAGINSAIQNQQTQAGSNTIAQEFGGAGGQAADAARSLLARDNPEFAKTMGDTATATQNLLGSYNLNGLSPGEANAVERSTNQSNSASGNLGLANPTNVISNAMNFGQAFDAKRAALNTAIGTGNQTASTAIGAFNPLSVATAQPGTSGLTQFNQSNTGTAGAQGALSFGQGLMGNQFGANNAAESAVASRANANSVPSYLGSMPSYS